MPRVLVKLSPVFFSLLLVLVSCSKLERIADRLTGGLSELISEAAGDLVEASIKVVFQGFALQQDNPNLLAFEAETKTGRIFKGVAIGAVGALKSGDVTLKGKVFTIEGEALLLANASTQDTSLPLVLMATETDTNFKDLRLGMNLSEEARITLSAETLVQGTHSPTVFRYIGETEKNNSILGIGYTYIDLPDATKPSTLSWQAEGRISYSGVVEQQSIGTILQAKASLNTRSPAGNTIDLEVPYLAALFISKP